MQQAPYPPLPRSNRHHHPSRPSHLDLSANCDPLHPTPRRNRHDPPAAAQRPRLPIAHHQHTPRQLTACRRDPTAVIHTLHTTTYQCTGTHRRDAVRHDPCTPTRRRDPPRFGRRRNAPAATRRFPLWPARRRQPDVIHPPPVAAHPCDPPAATYPPSRAAAAVYPLRPTPRSYSPCRGSPPQRPDGHPAPATMTFRPLHGRPCDQPTATHPPGATLATHPPWPTRRHPPAATHPTRATFGAGYPPRNTRRDPSAAAHPPPASTRRPPAAPTQPVSQRSLRSRLCKRPPPHGVAR